jgi:hypothetical protein
LETSWVQILAACAFLLVLAALLVVRGWLPPTFNGIDPERHFSLKNQPISHNDSFPLNNTSTIIHPSAVDSIFAQDNGRFAKKT